MFVLSLSPFLTPLTFFLCNCPSQYPMHCILRSRSLYRFLCPWLCFSSFWPKLFPRLHSWFHSLESICSSPWYSLLCPSVSPSLSWMFTSGLQQPIKWLHGSRESSYIFFRDFCWCVDLLTQAILLICLTRLEPILIIVIDLIITAQLLTFLTKSSMRLLQTIIFEELMEDTLLRNERLECILRTNPTELLSELAMEQKSETLQTRQSIPQVRCFIPFVFLNQCWSEDKNVIAIVSQIWYLCQSYWVEEKRGIIVRKHWFSFCFRHFSFIRGRTGRLSFIFYLEFITCLFYSFSSIWRIKPDGEGTMVTEMKDLLWFPVSHHPCFLFHFFLSSIRISVFILSLILKEKNEHFLASRTTSVIRLCWDFLPLLVRKEKKSYPEKVEKTGDQFLYSS